MTWLLNYISTQKHLLGSNIVIKIPETFKFCIKALLFIEIAEFSQSKSGIHRPFLRSVISCFCCRFVWQAFWHRLRQFQVKVCPIFYIPASKDLCLIKESCLSYCQILTYGVRSPKSYPIYENLAYRSSIIHKSDYIV